MQNPLFSETIVDKMAEQLTSERTNKSVQVSDQTQQKLMQICAVLSKQSSRLIKPHAVMCLLIEEGAERLLESVADANTDK